MKIRNSFVSNSSSSSFIVAINTSEECPHCHRKDPNFLDIIENYPDDGYGESTKLYLRTNSVDSLKRFSGIECDIYDTVQKYIDEGKEIGYLSIRYGDDANYNLLHDLIERGTVVKIWGDH